MKLYQPPSNTVFGRARELEIGIDSVLSAPQETVLSLTGPRGVGKSRLAVEIAKRLAPSLRDGAKVVQLNELQSVEEIEEALLRAAKFVSKAKTSNKHGTPGSLLILDQFEHLSGQGTNALRAILKSEPSTRVIVTARYHLDMVGEQCIQVPPLLTPEASGQSECPSVLLFLDRSVAASRDEITSERDIATVARLSSLVDGIPLAVEIVAGLTANASLGELLVSLERLRHGRRAAASMFPALYSAIQLGFNMLPSDLQRFLAEISVFRSEISIEAAQAFYPWAEAQVALAELSKRFMVTPMPRSNRYRIHDAVREYAWETLAGEDRATIRGRHGEHFLALAERLPSDAEMEHGNFSTALQWCCDTENVELGMRLAHALQDYWQVAGSQKEARRWLQRLLAIPDGTVPPELSERAQTALAGFV